jgi:RHO1 GDP-GTP exchange protein 1/2
MALQSATSTTEYTSPSLTFTPKLSFLIQPIPLELLNLANFSDPPTQCRLRGFGRGKGDAQVIFPGIIHNLVIESRTVYPFTILHTGRLGGLHTMYADSAQARSEWKEKLQGAIGLHKVVQESNKAFELETLSSDTFVVPSPPTNQLRSSNMESPFTGKVTCSVPFSMQHGLANISPPILTWSFIATADGRALVAFGCAEGVWIGFHSDPRSEIWVAVIPCCSSTALQLCAGCCTTRRSGSVRCLKPLGSSLYLLTR